jgi:hypothetical protein
MKNIIIFFKLNSVGYISRITVLQEFHRGDLIYSSTFPEDKQRSHFFKKRKTSGLKTPVSQNHSYKSISAEIQ